MEVLTRGTLRHVLSRAAPNSDFFFYAANAARAAEQAAARQESRQRDVDDDVSGEEGGAASHLDLADGRYVRVGGDVAHFHRPVDARRAGIEVVYQDLALCDNLTAAANVFLGRELKRGIWPFQALDYAAMYAKAAELFAEANGAAYIRTHAPGALRDGLKILKALGKDR